MKFDFVNFVHQLINENLNDISIDSNSNKNEKTIEGIQQEAIAPVKKLVGYDYLYRKMKQMYGKKEAKRLSGEMYDLSLGLADSTNIPRPYSYYGNTSIILRINGNIKYWTLKKLYNFYEEFSSYDKNSDMYIINTEKVYKKYNINSSMIANAITKRKDTKTYKQGCLNEKIKEDHKIEVWDNKNGWVDILFIIKHKQEEDKKYIIYQTENGDFAFVTEDHPVIMGNREEKIASNLNIGDEILKEEIDYNFDSFIHIPTKLAYFLGFLLGDGNCQCYDIDKEHYNINYENRGIKFTRGGNLFSLYQKNIDNSYILKIAKELFPNANFWKCTDKSDRTINFSSKELSLLLTLYFGIPYKTNSFSTVLPENILNWGKESKEAFIAGIIDSDGTIFKKSGRIDIRMMSYNIINGIYEILKSIDCKGIRKRISGDKIDNIIFGISFRSNEELFKFSEKIQNLYLENKNIFNYDEKYSTVSNKNTINKIIYFKKSDVTRKFFLEELENVYDITTSTGTFYTNGMTQHNCFAVDASKLVTIGRPFGQLHSKPCKRVDSYVAALCETIHQLGSHLAGALAIGTFFFDIAHLLLYKEQCTLRDIKTDKKIRKYLENEYQHFVHSINHLSRNGVESNFVNISIFDRIKLKTFIDEMNWYFSFDSLPINKPDIENEEELKLFYENYIIDYILELQNIFLNFFDKGDISKGGVPFRFPLVTINLSKVKKEDKEIIEDTKILKDVCKRDIFRYNIFTSEGLKVCSCCRLQSNIEMLEYASQSNSFGAGGAIQLGSHRVCTINFVRIALESKNKEEFFNILLNRIEDTIKILNSHRELIKDLIDKKLQPFFDLGWLVLSRMFSTVGIIGLYESAKMIQIKGYKEEDIIKETLVFLNNKVTELSQKFNLPYNIEQIPAESYAVRFAEVDRLIYRKEKQPYELYSNQFIPLWEEATLWERLDKDGMYNKLITGGGIVHAQIGEKITSKQAEKIIKYAVNAGAEHFALNSVYSECIDGHCTFGKSILCPICGKEIIEYYTRIVGFFTPVSSWNKVRREWEFDKRKFVSID